MFGYVRPYKSEMLVREYEQYKAVYCEVCRQLGKEYGWTARFTLSYDCTFYALLALSVSGAKVRLHQGRCTTNPLKKCSYLEAPGEEYKKAAALSVLLTYHKLRDNIEDESFWKSLGCKLLLPLVSRKAKKAAVRYPFLAEAAARAWIPAPSPRRTCWPRCSGSWAAVTRDRAPPWNGSATSWAAGSI